jgi:heptosyltransferase-1
VPRFLIVRLGALGDIVHAIPVAAALRRAFPAGRIDWIVSARHREILDLVPVIDRRILIGDHVWSSAAAAHDSSRSTRIFSLVGAMREVRRARYDVVIDLQGLIKSAMLARGAGAPRVIGFAASYARERLARRFYTEAYDPGRGGLYDPRETRHVVEINLGILTLLGAAGGAPEFPIQHVGSPVGENVRERTSGRYALLNPGAAWPNKRWPAARFAQIAAVLCERHDLTPVVLWGPGEQALAREVVEAARGAAMLAPPTTVVDLVALARGAALMISGDTGPAHIASAVGTPIVGIYGPTRAVRNGPLSPFDVTVSRDAMCRCHHLRRCTARRLCLLDIAVEEVVEAVDRRLTLEPSRV